MPLSIRMLTAADAALLDSVAADVFDDPIDAFALRVFLNDARHHLAAALEDGLVVGMVTSVHYAHPDKALPELWVNEVGVASTHRGRGIAKALMQATLDHARALQCTEAWVLTERENTAAMALYASAGGRETPPDAVMFTFDLKP